MLDGSGADGKRKCGLLFLFVLVYGPLYGPLFFTLALELVHGGQRVGAYPAPYDDGVRHIVQLGEDVAEEDGEGKNRQFPEDASGGEVLVFKSPLLSFVQI